MTKRKKAILIIIAALVAIVISGFLYVFYSYEKIIYDVNKQTNISNVEKDAKTNVSQNGDEKQEDNTSHENIDIEYKEIEGITNILLVGIDARTLDETSRSDAVMILTLDDIHKKIKLTSIMRDTFANIPKHGQEKITHAFAYGGIELLKETIELNYEVKIDNFAIINFFGFKDLIDSIGGLEIDVKESELKELNRCIMLEIEDNKDLTIEDAHFVENTGLQLLNGQQVLAYSRMRHIGNGGYDRSKRQRFVVDLIINKFKDISLLKYPSVANRLLPYVKTDLEFTEALNTAYTAYSIGNFDIQQLQIPANKLSYGRIYKDKGWVLLTDKKQNVDVIHKFIFDDIEYNPDDYTTFIYSKSEYYYYEPPVEEETEEEEDIQEEGQDENIEEQENDSDLNNEERDRDRIDEESNIDDDDSNSDEFINEEIDNEDTNNQNESQKDENNNQQDDEIDDEEVIEDNEDEKIDSEQQNNQNQNIEDIGESGIGDGFFDFGDEETNQGNDPETNKDDDVEENTGSSNNVNVDEGDADTQNQNAEESHN